VLYRFPSRELSVTASDGHDTEDFSGTGKTFLSICIISPALAGVKVKNTKKKRIRVFILNIDIRERLHFYESDE
jgi:hypothetical protein